MSKSKEEQKLPAEDVLEEAAAPAEPEDSPAEEAPEDVRKELEAAQQEIAQLNDRLLRSAAEFDNFRKRTQKEKGEMMSFSKAACVKEMLGAVDSFERALAADCKDPEFKKGMEMIFSQMNDALQKLGVREIEALNQPFNPDLHNAIKQVEDENFGENTICQVLQKGYQLEDRVIRHSMVVVANP